MDDGSGVYTKLGASVAVTATTIASSPYNTQNDDYVTALNARLNINGVKAMTGNLLMGSNKITSLATGTVATDAANVGQIQSGISSHSASVGGTVDVITAVHAPVMTTWVGMTGFRGIFTATGANTSATPTFNPDGIGAKTLVKLNNLALVAGDISGAGHEVEWEYNGTNVVILNPARIGKSVVTMEGKAINEAKGAAVASAATTDIWTPADGNYLHITGTTTITSLGTAPQAGAERTIIFDGVLTLTHNATSLILPSGANIITAAGDRMIVRADTTANMIVVDYIRASGQPIVVTASRTLLATLTTTSGTTQSATGLNPALYRYYEIEIVGVSFAGTTSLMLATSGNGGTNYGSAAFISPAVSSASDTFDGIILLMGINGTNQRSPVVPFGVPNTSSSGVSQGQTAPKHATGSGSPVDAIQFSGNGGSTFDAGTIRIYGVP